MSATMAPRMVAIITLFTCVLQATNSYIVSLNEEAPSDNTTWPLIFDHVSEKGNLNSTHQTNDTRIVNNNSQNVDESPAFVSKFKGFGLRLKRSTGTTRRQDRSTRRRTGIQTSSRPRPTAQQSQCRPGSSTRPRPGSSTRPRPGSSTLSRPGRSTRRLIGSSTRRGTGSSSHRRIGSSSQRRTGSSSLRRRTGTLSQRRRISSTRPGTRCRPTETGDGNESDVGDENLSDNADELQTPTETNDSENTGAEPSGDHNTGANDDNENQQTNGNEELKTPQKTGVSEDPANNNGAKDVENLQNNGNEELQTPHKTGDSVSKVPADNNGAKDNENLQNDPETPVKEEYDTSEDCTVSQRGRSKRAVCPLPTVISVFTNPPRPAINTLPVATVKTNTPANIMKAPYPTLKEKFESHKNTKAYKNAQNAVTQEIERLKKQGLTTKQMSTVKIARGVRPTDPLIFHAIGPIRKDDRISKWDQATKRATPLIEVKDPALLNQLYQDLNIKRLRDELNQDHPDQTIIANEINGFLQGVKGEAKELKLLTPGTRVYDTSPLTAETVEHLFNGHGDPRDPGKFSGVHDASVFYGNSRAHDLVRGIVTDVVPFGPGVITSIANLDMEWTSKNTQTYIENGEQKKKTDRTTTKLHKDFTSLFVGVPPKHQALTYLEVFHNTPGIKEVDFSMATEADPNNPVFIRLIKTHDLRHIKTAFPVVDRDKLLKLQKQQLFGNLS